MKGRGGEGKRGEDRREEQLAEGRDCCEVAQLRGKEDRAGNLVTKSHPVLLGPEVTAGRSQATEPCWFSEPC